MKSPMEYGKASGILLLNKYLPKVTPFSNIDVISTLEEWDAVKEKYGDFAAHRVDYPIGSPLRNSVAGTSGFTRDTPGLIRKANEQSSDAVVLVMGTKEPACPRYEYDGGFNALFLVDEAVLVELVGKAFDGHEATQGLAVHEYYKIPWERLLFIEDRDDLMKDAEVARRFVSAEEYVAQYAARREFLVGDCGYDPEKVDSYLPRKYRPLNDGIIESFLNDIVFELLKQKWKLVSDGLRQFGVQGNFVHGDVQPWEIFRAKRWGL